MLEQEINLGVLLLFLHPEKNKVKSPSTSLCSITPSVLCVFYRILNPHSFMEYCLVSAPSLSLLAPSLPNENVKVP